MGRGNAKYRKSLHEQAYERLFSMLSPGESKREAKIEGSDKDKIFSYQTYHTYKQHIGYFLSYMKKNHPEVTSLKKAKKYVNEFLEERCKPQASGKYLSVWTIKTEEAALNKLFGIEKSDPDRFISPSRTRADIKRSRIDVKADRHFSSTNNAELIYFCRGTGCRRNVVEKLVGNDYYSKERMQEEVERLEKISTKRDLSDLEKTDYQNLKAALSMFPEETDFVRHRRDKGGKSRYAPIIGRHKQDIIDRFLDREADEKVWENVHSKADIHSYRADYVNGVYRKYARDMNDIPKDRINKAGIRYSSQIYYCRNDKKGERYDKTAMQKASFAAGHNRLSVIAGNYLYSQ